ncbi:hypothetical protein A2U01_0055075, partial [Trifolium medium]|nr:hypothetical protein [Trifolium medium]
MFPTLYNKILQHDAYISDMGTWHSNMWSWKLAWTDTLADTEIEIAHELQQLLEQSDQRIWFWRADRLIGAVIDTHIVEALKKLWKNTVPSK